jgi:hypothetical protein
MAYVVMDRVRSAQKSKEKRNQKKVMPDLIEVGVANLRQRKHNKQMPSDLIEVGVANLRQRKHNKQMPSDLIEVVVANLKHSDGCTAALECLDNAFDERVDPLPTPPKRHRGQQRALAQKQGGSVSREVVAAGKVDSPEVRTHPRHGLHSHVRQVHKLSHVDRHDLQVQDSGGHGSHVRARKTVVHGHSSHVRARKTVVATVVTYVHGHSSARTWLSREQRV